MSIDTTLPGFFITYKDGGLVVTSNVDNSDRILIIGCSMDGPTNRPIAVSNLQDAQALFGPLIYKDDYLNPVGGTADGSPAGNSLVKAMSEAILGGGSNFLLVRVGGTVATGSGGFSSQIAVNGRYGGRVYNSATVLAASGSGTVTLTVSQPTVKGPTLTYTFQNADTWRTITNTINSDLNNKSVTLTCPASAGGSAANTLTLGTVTLSGGTNGTAAIGEDFGTSAHGIYTALTDATTGTFVALADITFDIAIMAAMYADDCVTTNTGDSGATTTSVAQDFSSFLYSVSKNNYPAYGTIGLRPIQKTLVTDLNVYTNANYLSTAAGFADINLRQIKFGYFMNSGFGVADSDLGTTVDTGRFLMIPAGPDIITSQKDLGLYIENGYAVLAGAMSKIPSKDAITRNPLGQIAALTSEFSKATHVALNAGVGRDKATRLPGGGAYVTFKTYDDLGRPAVVQDVTAAKRGSDYQYMQILRICNTAVHLVRAAALPYIGKGMDLPTRSALRTAIDANLKILADSGALIGGAGTGYDFSVSSDPSQAVLGIIQISVRLKPSFQLRFIEIEVSVSQ
jgi:hypothetical protein